MIRQLFVVATALALAACGSAGGAVQSASHIAAGAADAAGIAAPAPLNAVAIDEKALILASKAVSTTAVASSALVKTGIITKGSPTALSLARWLDTARDAVNAAAEARAAGSAESYTEALARAEGAVEAIRAIINPAGG